MATTRVAMAMSGGVDSSAAAAILIESGYDLIGFSMQLWDQRRSRFEANEFRSARCCSLDDLNEARSVAARLKIPYYVVNFQNAFEHTVVRTFIENYRNGLTPSPCVLCNSRMKFDRLMRIAENVKASYIATGHYARVVFDRANERYVLFRAKDKNKDQSYFLFELSQAQLSKAMFPLGELHKEQVRRIALRRKLPVADKPESQEICFIPDRDYSAFVESHCCEILGLTQRSGLFPSGQIVDRKGRILGTHRGIHRYTIGQRRGLGIAHSKPLYVLELRSEQNQVVVGERSQLRRHLCRIERPNWISIHNLVEPLRVKAKIRSRHEAAPATITPADDGEVQVRFDTPQPAISPGQACVFYQHEKVVGGGWIKKD